MSARRAERKASPLSELARVLVRLDHVACFAWANVVSAGPVQSSLSTSDPKSSFFYFLFLPIGLQLFGRANYEITFFNAETGQAVCGGSRQLIRQRNHRSAV
jgi:hypothetical protein